jgi:hypothetical protein
MRLPYLHVAVEPHVRHTAVASIILHVQHTSHIACAVVTATPQMQHWTLVVPPTDSALRHPQPPPPPAPGCDLAAAEGLSGPFSGTLARIYVTRDCGLTWTSNAAQGSGASYGFTRLAGSADGTKLVTAERQGFIFVSSNRGASWGVRMSGTRRNWGAMTSSSDGSRLVVLESPGFVWTSGDGGSSWGMRADSRDWSAVSSSSDGSKVVAAVGGGQIYTCRPYGPNPRDYKYPEDTSNAWIPRDSARNWAALASSSDGDKLVAVVNGGRIYTSSNTGISWIARESVRKWAAVASSADGSRLLAAESGGMLYTSSDGGVSWQAREGPRNWVAVASSSDGTRLAAAEYGGLMYFSADAGTSWAARGSSRLWRGLAATG